MTSPVGDVPGGCSSSHRNVDLRSRPPRLRVSWLSSRTDAGRASRSCQVNLERVPARAHERSARGVRGSARRRRATPTRSTSTATFCCGNARSIRHGPNGYPVPTRRCRRSGEDAPASRSAAGRPGPRRPRAAGPPRTTRAGRGCGGRRGTPRREPDVAMHRAVEEAAIRSASATAVSSAVSGAAVSHRSRLSTTSIAARSRRRTRTPSGHRGDLRARIVSSTIARWPVQHAVPVGRRRAGHRRALAGPQPRRTDAYLIGEPVAGKQVDRRMQSLPRSLPRPPLHGRCRHAAGDGLTRASTPPCLQTRSSSDTASIDGHPPGPWPFRRTRARPRGLVADGRGRSAIGTGMIDLSVT